MVPRYVRVALALLLGVAAALANAQPSPPARKRVALVIGNAAYAVHPLRNAAHDATDMAAALSALGYATRIQRDASVAAMREAIARFGIESEGAEAAFFYFAGQSTQAGTTVKLGGVDDTLPRLSNPVLLEEVFEQVRKAKARYNFVVLDSARQAEGPEAPPIGDPPAPPDTLVAYATSSGDPAMDGFGRNGAYTGRLLQEIQRPGVQAEAVFKRVREAVSRDTKGLQTPIDSSRFRGDYAFVEAPPSRPVAEATASPIPPRFRLAPPPGEVRVALVVGNGRYPNAPLPNPPYDADDMAKALGIAGFKVILRKDVGYREMRAAVREFGAALKGATTGLFYFAGHGLQIKGRNYLVPADSDIGSEADAEDLSIDANYVLATMEESGSKVNVMILDSCRNNPYSRSFRSATLGLAPMQAASGMVIAFATAPGSLASDGARGRNGLYTGHLLRNLDSGDADILKVFQRTRAAVVRETGGRQVPWESTSLVGDFHFRVPVPAP